jgi:hypothetical protein
LVLDLSYIEQAINIDVSRRVKFWNLSDWKRSAVTILMDDATIPPRRRQTQALKVFVRSKIEISAVRPGKREPDGHPVYDGIIGRISELKIARIYVRKCVENDYNIGEVFANFINPTRQQRRVKTAVIFSLGLEEDPGANTSSTSITTNRP